MVVISEDQRQITTQQQKTNIVTQRIKSKTARESQTYSEEHCAVQCGVPVPRVAVERLKRG